jgi:small conductance mechanosensitive channel
MLPSARVSNPRRFSRQARICPPAAGELLYPDVLTYDGDRAMGNWLNAEFWHGILKSCVAWLVTTSPSILVILALGIIGLKALNFGIGRLKVILLASKEKGDPDVDLETAKRVQTLVDLLHALAKVVLLVVVGMLLLMKLGVNIAPIIAGAGIVGLAVGFGAQELVRDVISGFFILLENQVRTGDVAVINGTGGLVENIGLRTITLRDQSGTVHVFQNGKINSLSNMTKTWSAMVFDVGVAYREDTDKVVEVMKAVGEDLRQDPQFARKIIEPLEVMGVDAFGDNAVTIKARFKTLPIEQWGVGREYRRRLKKAFDAAGIEIPFPHRTLYWGDAGNPLQLASAKAGAGADGAEEPPPPKSSRNS